MAGPVVVGNAEQIRGLVTAEQPDARNRQTPQGRQPDERAHEVEQRLCQRNPLGAGLLVALTDQHLQPIQVAPLDRQDGGVDAEQPTRDVPQMAVVRRRRFVVRDVQTIEHMQQRRAPRDHRAEQMLLVDGRGPVRVPVRSARDIDTLRDARVGGDQLAHAGVHETYPPSRVVPLPARFERTGAGDVEHELRGFEHATLGVRLQFRGERQHLRAVVGGVRQRQRVQEQPQAKLKAPRVEEVGAVAHPLDVGPRGKRRSVRQPGGDLRLEQLVAPRLGGDDRVEQVGGVTSQVMRGQRVTFRIGLQPQLVQPGLVDQHHDYLRPFGTATINQVPLPALSGPPQHSGEGGTPWPP